MILILNQAYWIFGIRLDPGHIIIICPELNSVLNLWSENFDIIFADPPYELYDLNIFVENALKKLNEGGMLIIECSSKETLEGFDKIAKFGDTNLLYWKVWKG